MLNGTTTTMLNNTNITNSTNSTIPSFKFPPLLPGTPLQARRATFYIVVGGSLVCTIVSLIVYLKVRPRAKNPEKLYGTQDGQVTKAVETYATTLRRNRDILFTLQVALYWNIMQIFQKDSKSCWESYMCQLCLLGVTLHQNWNLWSFAKKYEPPRVFMDIELTDLHPGHAAHDCECVHVGDPAPPYIPDRAHLRHPL
ncbi:hypothetical protein FLONG3_3961 [Fusarium longipes]|uniref:Uncharacterized protein n=1 Tax=Fusarium longipes TaxID=694270 RepID=A0A395T0Q1_9HYPO|nr:hypothetical protein FLONG3_3961 [Fusarium longipes]